MPKALFVNADSSKHILSGDACYSEKGKQIVSAIWGNGPKDESLLGRGVYNQYGVGKEGFDTVSCQFAIHYFFENRIKLHTFLRNVCEGCKVGGYFIGTCYDGKRVFNELRGIKQGESVSEYKNEQKIWEIKKQYDRDEFKNDETSIGLAIDVFQETINKMFREYLVNFDYLTRIMKNYGFEVLSKDEAKDNHMPNGIGSFSELYNKMNSKIVRDKHKKGLKSFENSDYGEAENLKKESGEQRISFLNNYFIYKKITDVNAKEVFDMFTKDVVINDDDSDGDDSDRDETPEKVKTPEEVQKPSTIKTKKRIKKLILKKSLKK